MFKTGVGRLLPLVLSGLAVLISLGTAGFVVGGAQSGDSLVRATAPVVASPEPPFDGDWARRILFPTQARPDSPHHNHMVSLAYNWDWNPEGGWSREVDTPSVALTMESWYEGLAELNFDMRPSQRSTDWLGGRVMGFAARHDGSYATLALGGNMYSPGGAGIKLTGGMTGEPLLLLNEGTQPRDAVVRVRHGDGRSAVVLRGGTEPSLAFGFAGESADGAQEGALRFYGPATQDPLINVVGSGDATLLASRPSLSDNAPRFRMSADRRLDWDDGKGRGASLSAGSGRLDVRGELTAAALRVGDDGAVLRGLRVLAVRLAPEPVAPKAMGEQIFSVPGMPADAMVLMAGPAQPDGVALTGARAIRPGEVAVRFANLADGEVKPTEGVYQIVVIEADP